MIEHFESNWRPRFPIFSISVPSRPFFRFTSRPWKNMGMTGSSRTNW